MRFLVQIGLLLVFLLGFARPAIGEDLLSITSRAKDLDDFLAHPEWVNDYYAELRTKHGADRFPRESFDLILGQLREIVVKVPELKARLWERGEGEAFSFSAVTTNYGRAVDFGRWTSQLNDTMANLEAAAEPYLGLTPEKAKQKSEVVLAERSELIREFYRDRVKRQTLNQGGHEEVAAFYRSVSDDRELRAAVAYRLKMEMKSEVVQDKLHSANADTILDTMRVLRKFPGAYLPEFKSGGMQSHIRALLPEFNSLYAKTDIFPLSGNGKSGGESQFHFSPVSRVLDGIWKGIPLGECVGGNCHFKDSLTPERWLSSALEGARLYDVSETLAGRKIHQGFVQLVPIRHVKTGQIYASVDFGASAMKDQAFIEDAVTGEKRQSTVVSQFIEEAPRHLPEALRRLVVGESLSINNAQVVSTLHKLPEYRTAPSVGKSSKFELLGKLAKSIIAASPARRGQAVNYSGRMIFDAFVPLAGKLRLLVPFAEKRARDPEQLLRALNGWDAKLKSNWIGYLQERGGVSPEIAALPQVRRLYLGERLQSTKAQINAAARYDLGRIELFSAKIALSQGLLWGLYWINPNSFENIFSVSMAAGGLQAYILGAGLLDRVLARKKTGNPFFTPEKIRWQIFQTHVDEIKSRAFGVVPSCVRAWSGIGSVTSGSPSP